MTIEPVLYTTILNLSMGVIVLPLAWRLWKNRPLTGWSQYDSSETFFWAAVLALLATAAWLVCSMTMFFAQ